MRTFVLVLVLLGLCLGLTGCWFYDGVHNRRHWSIIKGDLREIHADLDFLLAIESENPMIEAHNR